MNTSNETQLNHTVVPSFDYLQVVVNVAFMIVGFVAASSNFIIILLILLCRKLHRKELIILVGLAVGDVIYATGYIIGGSRRLVLVLKNQHTTYVTAWTCQLVSHTFFYVIGPQISSMMNVVISFDRLMSVVLFSVYQSLNVRYVFTLTGIVFVVATASYFTGFIMAATMPPVPNVLALCLSTQASWPSYGTFYTSLIAVCNCTNVVVYCFVMGILKYRAKHATGMIYDIQLKRQLKVTKMIGITSFVDFLLDVIPWVIQVSVNASHLPDSVTKIVSLVTWVFIQCKRIVTVLVYMWKLKDLRQAFREMLRCKLKGTKIGISSINNVTYRSQALHSVGRVTVTRHDQHHSETPL